MKLRNRFLLVGLGVILFLIVTPIIVLYARGFKYDFGSGKIVKTGTLVVKTSPTKTKVYLDGILQKGQTPLNIRFLSPQDFQVKIEKEGYQSWTKRLTVNSQLVTWANLNRDFITLFLQNAKLEQSFIAANPLVSKNDEEIEFSENEAYKLLNIKNGDIITLGAASEIGLPNIPTNAFVWQNGSKIFEMLLTKNALPIPDELFKTLKYAESDGEHVIFIFGSDLYSYDLNHLFLVDKSITTATLDSDGIWYISNNNIKHFDFSRNTSDFVISNLPVATRTLIQRSEGKIFLNLDQTLYVVNDKLDPIYSPTTFATWDSISHQLVFGNSNEIQIYNPVTKNSELILRSITSMSNPVLNTETGYVFYIQDNKIKATELDGRDYRNTYTIIENSGNNPLFELSPDGKKLYLFNDDGGKIFTIR